MRPKLVQTGGLLTEGDGELFGEESTRTGASTTASAAEKAAGEEMSVAVSDEEKGNKKAGFKRSTDTVRHFWFFKMLKVLGPRHRTGNGPSYGGTNGFLTASMRSRTWETDIRAGST